jgi:kynurenine formamidase
VFEKLPDYDSLPTIDGGARSGWGLFGHDDSVGLLNLQTPERIARAARLIRRGAVFPLDPPIDGFDPPFGQRAAPRHRVEEHHGLAFDDRLDGFYLQTGAQWDSLAHVGYRPGVFYNGATSADIRSGRRNTIEHWAQRGIAGRALLIDVARTRERAGRAFDPLESHAITVGDLEEARVAARVEYEPGDVILIRTGFVEAYSALDRDRRVANGGNCAGLEHTEPMARYLWDTHAAAIGADNPSVEVFPTAVDIAAPFPMAGWPFGSLHHILIGLFGMAVGELFDLADLAADCERDGVHTTFFTSAPMNLRGGIGSPANAIAIK